MELYGQWTPVQTFATQGNLAPAPTLQVGNWARNGNRVAVDFDYSGVPVFTTATGAMQLISLPVSPLALTNYAVSVPIEFQGISKAGYSTVSARATTGSLILTFYASGMGMTDDPVTALDVPAGGTLILRGTITFNIAF